MMRKPDLSLRKKKYHRIEQMKSMYKTVTLLLFIFQAIPLLSSLKSEMTQSLVGSLRAYKKEDNKVSPQFAADDNAIWKSYGRLV
jgi:hypothetical protein